MKKILSFIIACILCISPAGCGNQTATDGTQPEAAESQAAESQAAKAQESYASARISYPDRRARTHRKPAISSLTCREV